MIRIAICDNEERAVASTEKIVKTCLQAQGIGCEITTYTQSRNLLYDITDDGFFYKGKLYGRYARTTQPRDTSGRPFFGSALIFENHFSDVSCCGIIFPPVLCVWNQL